MRKLILLTLLTLSASVVSAADTNAVKKTPRPDDRTNLLEKIPQENSYVGYVSVETVSPGFFGDGGINLGITTSHGYMIREDIFIGAGAGYIADVHNKQGIIPIFAEARYFFRSQYQRRIYPHIGARAGGQIATEGGAGYLAQIGIGFRVPLTEKLALNLEVGPQYASAYERKHAYNSISTGQPYTSAKAKFQFFGRISFEF